MNQPDRWRAWATANIGLITTALLGAFTLIRLIRVSASNETTALAILQHSGTADAIFASALQVVPFATVYGTAYALRRMLSAENRMIYVSPLVVLAVFTFLVVPVAIIAVGAVRSSPCGAPGLNAPFSSEWPWVSDSWPWKSSCSTEICGCRRK